MITKRDQDILNFLNDFHIATSSQLHRLFFGNVSNRYARIRLQYLHDDLKLIKKTKSTIDNCTAFYTEKKPVQIHHDLLRAEVFTSLKKLYNVLEWGNEVGIGNIRPDAVTFINDHGIVFPVFIEIHLNNHFDFDKYKELIAKNDLKAMLGLMPRVVICTDRQVTVPANMGIKFKIIGVDMKGIETLFKPGFI